MKNPSAVALGKMTSDKKAKASRLNGIKGGRPRRARGSSFWSNVEKTGNCWEWLAGKSAAGYGMSKSGKKMEYAHRLSWTEANGVIPSDLVIDHLCRNRSCVNPAHMELVSRGENVLRGESTSAIHARKTHCMYGHLLDEQNIYRLKTRNTRICKRCHTNRTAKRRQKRKDGI